MKSKSKRFNDYVVDKYIRGKSYSGESGLQADEQRKLKLVVDNL